MRRPLTRSHACTRSRVAAALAAVALATVAMTPAVGTAGHEPGDDDPRPTSARGQTPPIYSKSIVTQLDVETTWGTLRGELRRPTALNGQPLANTPVILQISPYGILNEGLSLYDDINADATADYFVARGYAYAIFDAIGTHASGGCADFGGLAERESTAQLVDHLGELAWTNGNVGMIGASYDGTLAIAAAVENPAHLKAIIPQVSIDRWYDYMYDDGVRMALEDSSGRGGATPADPPADSPLDYDVAYGVVPDHTQAPASIAGATVEHVMPCNRVEHLVRGYEPDPLYDQFWIDRDYRALAGNVTAAVLFEGAWLDDNVKHEAGPSFINALPETTPKHLVIGQWTHATSKFTDAMNLRHAWFDTYLYGKNTGVEHLRTYDSQADDGQRRQDDAWPPTGTATVAVDLTKDWTIASGGGGAIAWDDTDKVLVEERLVRGDCSDACVQLVGPTATAAYRVVGTPVLDVRVLSSSTHLAPVLIEVLPNGTREVIARGFLDTRNRNSLAKTEAHGVLAYDARVYLWPVDVLVQPGGRLELILTSVNATFGVPDSTVASVVVSAGTLRLPVLGDVDRGLVTSLVTIEQL